MWTDEIPAAQICTPGDQETGCLIYYMLLTYTSYRFTPSHNSGTQAALASLVTDCVSRQPSAQLVMYSKVSISINLWRELLIAVAVVSKNISINSVQVWCSLSSSSGGKDCENSPSRSVLTFNLRWPPLATAVIIKAAAGGS